jgi:hypothetical protein
MDSDPKFGMTVISGMNGSLASSNGSRFGKMARRLGFAKTPVAHVGHIDRGVSDFRAMVTSACEHRSSGPKRA